jgi:metallo-beta-lactamase class B
MNRLILVAVFLIISVVYIQAQVLVVDDDIQLVHLHDSVFLHVTWDNDATYGRFSSNGMVLIRSGQALMVDTPTDDEKTERLVRWLRDKLSVKVTRVVIGHFHDDCLGGLGYLHRSGVISISNRLTAEKCRELKLPVTFIQFNDVLNFDFNGVPVECRYFGGGHTPDNITVWLPGMKILFGGCLIKSAESKGLGNLSDAVVDEWASTVEKLMATYDNIGIIIPGHGNTGGPELLEHTIRLVDAHLIPE